MLVDQFYISKLIALQVKGVFLSLNNMNITAKIKTGAMRLKKLQFLQIFSAVS